MKLRYNFTAVSPIHSGSDEVKGQYRPLRRERVLLDKPKEIYSKFASVEDKREAVLLIFEVILREIFRQDLKSSRLMRIYDEFANKLNAACSKASNKIEFFEILLNSFDIGPINEPLLLKALESFDDDELIQTIQNEHKYLILVYRSRKEKAKQEEKKGGNLSLFAEPSPEDFKLDYKIVKSFTEIPCLAGNSIRGKLRRLAMYDFAKLTHIEKFKSLEVFHQLAGGGALTDGSSVEDFSQLREVVEMCPMLGLFGSAMGKFMLPGRMDVHFARPHCIEHGTGDQSAKALTSIDFGTRRDSIMDEIGQSSAEGVKGEPQQMIYWTETFITGTKFAHGFDLKTENPLLVSAFWRLMELWKDNATVGAMGAKGYGELKIDLDIPFDGSRLYLEHLADNNDKINKYWTEVLSPQQVSKIEKAKKEKE